MAGSNEPEEATIGKNYNIYYNRTYNYMYVFNDKTMKPKGRLSSI